MLNIEKENALVIKPENGPNRRIDLFEGGMSAKRLKSIFHEIENSLKSILNQTLK